MSENAPKVIVIPAKPELVKSRVAKRQLRVAAYCRVSTDDEEQLTSYEAQQSYEAWKVKLKRFVVGWVNYYKLADMGGWLKGIDEWMRRRIRMVFWKRIRTRWHNLEKLGVSYSNAGILANSRKGHWRIASSPILHAALSNLRLEKDGFQFFFPYYYK